MGSVDVNGGVCEWWGVLPALRPGRAKRGRVSTTFASSRSMTDCSVTRLKPPSCFQTEERPPETNQWTIRTSRNMFWLCRPPRPGRVPSTSVLRDTFSTSMCSDRIPFGFACHDHGDGISDSDSEEDGQLSHMISDWLAGASKLLPPPTSTLPLLLLPVSGPASEDCRRPDAVRGSNVGLADDRR